MKKFNLKKLLPILITILIIIIDYVIKLLIINNIIYNETVNLIGEFVRLTFDYNYYFLFGWNFGIEDITVAQIIYSIIYIILLTVIIYFYIIIKKENILPKVFLGVLLGGMLGNFINILIGDLLFFGQLRFFFGKIVSYLLIGKPDFFVLPPFNLADLCIFIGTVILIIYLIRHREKEIFKSKPDDKEEK